MNNFSKKYTCSTILNSLIFAIIGLILIANPTGIINLLSTIIGILFVIVGIVEIINYFTSKNSFMYYNHGIISGLIAITIGAFILNFGYLFETALRFVLSFWMIFSSFVRFEFAFDLLKANIMEWFIVLLFAIAILICGIYVLITPGILILTLGIILFIYAFMDLIENILFIKSINKIK